MNSFCVDDYFSIYECANVCLLNKFEIENKINQHFHEININFFQSCLSSSPDFSLEHRQALATGNGIICVFIQLPVEDLRQLALRFLTSKS
jgi:predicted HAD superfamily hydrolase